MFLALNGATTMRADLETDLRVAHFAGFDAIEIWAAKLRAYAKRQTLRELRAALERYGLRAYSINSIEHITFRSPERWSELLAECEQLCAMAREIGCEYLVLVPSPRPEGVSEEAIREESVRVLSELSDVAARYGVNLAFEFLGFPECSVRTLTAGWEIVRRVARPNVGLVLDTFHFYVGGSSLDALAELDPERLFIVHLNDAEDRPKSELRDEHRLLPGLGILPLREIWSRLRALGYDRGVSVELFRPEYWEWDPAELAVRAKAAAERVLERA
ncbi:MAG: sugar phosphate isomerase/epimerase [Blastocatellia bacterium]|nr:sugar phosphate isomerase/epimerase [Blastocatellia bacterium]MCS7158643.1 sugar phosphate isomerase/epimerase [Blastocatellia bacterium]MCX7753576.1 sugar phosphate isomerase/epimerase [Blastocatellia bacterium]MDW8166872.1 sugar phosphate isomerase/epimerase [Acidobacteriota bacterium]MDW8257369.1 sugar phosphate isomerase/epimerase [Acidobacteriota bacterium]